MNWYKWIWSKIGGRPWTYITRDLWEQTEYLFIVGFTVVGFFSGFYWHEIVSFFARHPLALFASGFGLFTIGYICGHIWWGTEHIPSQPGE